MRILFTPDLDNLYHEASILDDSSNVKDFLPNLSNKEGLLDTMYNLDGIQIIREGFTWGLALDSNNCGRKLTWIASDSERVLG